MRAAFSVGVELLGRHSNVLRTLGNIDVDFKLEQWDPNLIVLLRNVKSTGYWASPQTY